MAIPPAYVHRLIYHFTHIDNIPRILRKGIRAKNDPHFPAHNHISIAEQAIQDRRATMAVTCGPRGLVHDYVPLYFGSRSLMLLAVVNKKNVDQCDIAYFEFPIAMLDRADVVFTDASANTADPPNFYCDPRELTRLNWAEIDSLKWSCATEQLRHQRMAEALVYGRLDVMAAQRVVVWNQYAKRKLEEMVRAASVAFPQIEYESTDRPHYFTKFMSGQPNESLVTGPRGIAEVYNNAREQLRASTRAARPQFRTFGEMLRGLRRNFGCLPQTNELVGLHSANPMHKLTVEMHTKEVVRRLRALPEFADLPDTDKDIVELAAYLHDIGKGPRSRWDTNGGLQKVDPDHPVGAMPMMVDIITTQVADTDKVASALLLKLVCYHDLVGDILGKGRDERQLADVATSSRELDLLFMLGKADASSLEEDWWPLEDATALYRRSLRSLRKP